MGFRSRVWFRDKNGVIVCNNHFDERYVKLGEQIKEGDIIGYEGSTGDCYPVGASHLHFELRDKLGTGYKNPNAAKYLGIPNKVGIYNSEQFYPAKKEPPKICIPFRHGDKVRVTAVTASGNKIYGKTYTNALYRIYHEVYNVIGDPKGNRVVIGVGNVIVAAVNGEHLEKLIN